VLVVEEGGRARAYPVQILVRPSVERALLFEGETNGRLPPKERIAAVFGERETLVAPFSRLFKQPVLNEELEGAPIVVMYKRGVASPLDAGAITASKDVGTAAAFGRRVAGRELTFRRQATA